MVKGNKSKRFRQAVTIRQVGAEPLRTPRGTVFKLGGGIFTKKQILASRRRYARVRVPRIAKRMRKSDFGL